MQRLVKFEVLGQEYPLYTDAPEEDVQEILNLVKEQLEGVDQSASLPMNKLAIVASLNMAGKFVRLRRDFENYKLEVEETLDRMQQNLSSVV